MLLWWRKPASTNGKKRRAFGAGPKSLPTSRCGYGFWTSRSNTIRSRMISSRRACTGGIRPFEAGRANPPLASRGYRPIPLVILRSRHQEGAPLPKSDPET
jgi:hypothetical protein